MPHVLLDTHTLFWWGKNSSQLSARARAVIQDPDTVVYISSASAWEIAHKAGQGKWPEALPLVGAFHSLLTDWEFEELPVTIAHGLYAGSIAFQLKDPFDSMLAAQATLENLNLITRDARLTEFLGSRVIW